MRDIKRSDGCYFVGETLTTAQAIIRFHRSGCDILVIDHTFVSENLKGQGIGAQLVMEVVNLARREKAKIQALCPFAIKMLRRNPEYADVLAPE